MASPKCKRPSCHKKAPKGQYGYCRTHSKSLGYAKPKVPYRDAMAIINRALNAGMNIPQIAKATGLEDSTLRTIIKTERPTVRHSTYAALQTLDTNNQPDPAYHPAWPIVRRVQALRAIGHTVKEIAEGTDLDPRVICRLSRPDKGEVRATTHHNIMRYYEAHKADPARRPTRQTAEQGWPVPAAWDNIDDPDEDPTKHVTYIHPRDISQLTEDDHEDAKLILKTHGSVHASGLAAHVAAATIAKIANHSLTEINTQTLYRIRDHAADIRVGAVRILRPTG